MPTIKDLFVYMNGIHVGMLTRTTPEHYQFTYQEIWLNHKNTRPISLSMPLRETPYKGETVYHFFNNLLPDSDIIRNRIQVRFQTPTNRCFDLLSQIGRDCVGALQLLTEPLSDDIKKVSAKPRSDKWIAKWLTNYRTAPLGMAENTEFRISIAGAQEKATLLRYKNKWCEPLESTPTTHIVKLPIGRIEHAGIDLTESVENEWLCLQILSAFGLPVNHAEITHFNGVKALVFERFDRRWQDKNHLIRLPQEDMCQALGKAGALKYENEGGPGMIDIMKILNGAYHAKSDRYQFMKTVFLFWVMGATDGHAKNFSLFIRENGQYELTPIYDVISSYPMATKRQIEWQDLKMAMSLKSKNRHYRWQKIQLRHWLTNAEYCQFSKISMRNIIDEVFEQTDSVLEQVANNLPKNFPEPIAESIFSGIKKMVRRWN